MHMYRNDHITYIRIVLELVVCALPYADHPATETE